MFFNTKKVFEKWNTILSFFYPRVCGICKKKIIQNFTCEKCFNILQYTMKKELCVRVREPYVDIMYSLFMYQGNIRELILDFKFHGKTYIGYTFAEHICRVMEQYQIKGDVLVSVPIHYKRYCERGYNQSDILAKFISKVMKIPYNKRVLKKIKHNPAQSTIAMSARKKNVQQVYQYNPKFDIREKIVVLIDDVFTTGATANECARVLKQNGAKKVICITIAYSGKTGRKQGEEF